jgi:hypothetical protein
LRKKSSDHRAAALAGTVPMLPACTLELQFGNVQSLAKETRHAPESLTRASRSGQNCRIIGLRGDAATEHEEYGS